jgi:hypothetical protein
MSSIFDINPGFTGKRGYAKELYKTFKTQQGLAPLRIQEEAKLQPYMTAQNLVNLDQFLTGTPEMDIPQYAYEPAVYRKTEKKGGLFSGGNLLAGVLSGGASMVPDIIGSKTGNGFTSGDLFGGGGGSGRELVRRERWTPNGTVRRGAQRGFLDIYNNAIIPTLTEAQTKMRTADISDVKNLSPEMRAALRASNPAAAALLDELEGQAQGDLAAGASLNPSELRNIQQAARMGQSARGMGSGPIDNFEEALKSLNYGRALQNDRRGFAGDVINQSQAFYGNPFQNILNRNSTAGQAGGIAGQGLGGSRLGNYINPESQYASDINSWNAQAQQMVTNAGAENNAAMISGIMSMFGNIGGGAMKAI